MMEYLLILERIAMLFIILIIGFIIRKLNILNSNSIKNMSSMLIKVTLPAMILSSMPDNSSNPVISSTGYILLISFGVYAVSLALAFIVSFILHTPRTEKGVIRFIVIFSNVGFMGYPVLEAVFGRSALFYAAIYNIPFNLLVFTLGISLLIKGKSDKFNINWKDFINAPSIAAIIGLLIMLTGIRLPGVIKDPLELLGEVTTPLSMIIIGGLLANISPSAIFTNWRIYAVSLFRLILIPLAVLFTLRLFIRNDPLLLGVPVIIAAMPAAANTALLAEEYDANPEFASQSVFVTTLLSVFTIPLIASFF